jgi:hypothetical protein
MLGSWALERAKAVRARIPRSVCAATAAVSSARVTEHGPWLLEESVTSMTSAFHAPS